MLLKWYLNTHNIYNDHAAVLQVRLPDIEFFVNLGDWPLEKRKASEKIHPIFSWCGSNNTRDIVMPTYDLTESVLETMGRYGWESETQTCCAISDKAEKCINITKFERNEQYYLDTLQFCSIMILFLSSGR